MIKRKHFWKCEWISICSIHQEYNKECYFCNKGCWSNTLLNTFSKFIYQHFPHLWKRFDNSRVISAKRDLANMASPSKIKGSAFESKMAKLLTEELGIEFKRMPLSGAIEYLKGDLWVPSDTAGFKYAIECKHYAELDWNNFLTAKSTDILQFWIQASEAAQKMKKSPLLLFRWNRSKDFVGYNDFSVNCQNYVEIKSFGQHFRIALLSEWIEEYKKINK